MKNAVYIIGNMLISIWVMNASLAIAQNQHDTQMDTLLEGFEASVAPMGGPSEEDLLEGFENGEPDTKSGMKPKKPQSNISLDGYLKVGATWNISHGKPQAGETDWRGLSKLRGEAQVDILTKLNADWRMLVSGKLCYDAAYTLQGRDEFTDEVKNAYESEAELREVYLQGRVGPNLDVKAGRQIVVWGRSDNLRITDVLNPLDMREPGLTDIEDLRLPVTMTRLDGYYGPWNLTGIAVHEIRFNKNPVYGHDFYPSPIPMPAEEVPSDGGTNTEWAVALNGTFSGKDFSIYWAELFNDNAHTGPSGTGTLVRKHARVRMWGAAGNLAMGNWLIKSETAYWTGLEYFNSGNETLQRWDALVGTEYSGLTDTTLSFEWAIMHLIDFDERIKTYPDYAQEDEITNALRITRTFENETIEVTLLALIYGPLGQDGSLSRISIEYDWSDAVSITFGAVLYQSGDRYTLRRIGDNDRIFAEMKYSF